MKKTVATAVLMFCMGAAFAAPVSAERAAAVARTFWTGTLHGKADVVLVDRTAEWQFDGIYLFTNPQGGFVMVAADDAVRPILGYSLTGQFDPQRMPIQLVEWLGTYQQQIDWVRDNDGRSYATDVEAWKLLDSGQPLKDATTDTVAPLLTTHWDQDEPYNELCPGNTVTGCAATAQAQLMKYWNHPVAGYSSHSYVHPTYGQQSAEFGHTFYDWNNMPDQPTIVSPDNVRRAVATLMYHCGVSLEMDYGTAEEGGSGALGLFEMEGYPTINNALMNYFGYSRDMVVRYKNMPMMGQTFTNEEWRALLIADLRSNLPLVYTGAAVEGGHAFVCDGFDSREYMHFNFGWSGIGDGFFPVDSISPGVGGAGGNVTYTFNMQNAALFGVVPDYDLRVSDTMLTFMSTGGTDSLILTLDPTINSNWSMECNAAWLSPEHVDFNDAGWIHITVESFTVGTEREATITFRQGTKSVQVRVLQVNFDESEFCPLTVVMESTRGEGWQDGAHLTLQTHSGYVFGTATLAEGELDSVLIPVAPHDVYAVWYPGGGADRYINYQVKNQHGETMVDVERAYYNGGTHFIEWPCAHVGIEPNVENGTWTVYPNPANDVLHVDGLPENGHIELYDALGRQVAMQQQSPLKLDGLSAGTYLLRIVTAEGIALQKVIIH